MNNQNINYCIYVRKSSESEDRQVQSIEDQKDVLERLAKDKGLKVKRTFIEAKSAKKPGRPVFNEMLNVIANGEINGIICWKLDRLSRNPIDAGTISWLLQKEEIKHIHTIDRSYYPSDNILMMSVELGMANQYVRDLRMNTMRGLKRKVEQGWYPAHPALGYIHNSLKKKGEKEVLPDPNSFHLVRKMFDLILTGNYTAQQVLNIATEEWGLRNRHNRKVTRNTIYVVLTNTFYYGVFEYPKGSGNFYNGAHEPMITIDEFNRVQELLGRADNPRPKKKKFAYTGLIKCAECGASITAEKKVKPQKNGNVHYYTYYHCTKRRKQKCTQKTLEEKKLNRQIENYLDRLYIPEDFLKWAVDEIKRTDENKMEKLNAIRASQQRELSVVKSMLDNLFDLRLCGNINDDEYSKKKAELQKRHDTLTFHLDENTSKIEKSQEATIDLLNFVHHAKEKFTNGGMEDKKFILSVLGSNLRIFNRKLLIEAEKPISYMENLAGELRAVSSENTRFEPAQVSIKKGVYGDFNTINPLVLRE